MIRQKLLAAIDRAKAQWGEQDKLTLALIDILAIFDDEQKNG